MQAIKPARSAVPALPRGFGWHGLGFPVGSSRRHHLGETTMLPRCLVVLPALLLLAPVFRADEPKPDTSRGDRLLWSYLRNETKSLADACLADVKTKEDW